MDVSTLPCCAVNAGFGWFETLERKIMHFATCTLHGDTLGPIFISVQSDKLGIPLILCSLALYSVWNAGRAWRATLAIAVGVGVGMLVVSALWFLIDRQRPPLQYEHLLRTPAERATCAAHPEALAVRAHISRSAAFPSRHALTVGVAVVVFWLVSPLLGGLATIYGLFVLIGRMYIGRHWPSDLVAGAALGAVLGWLAWRHLPRVLARLGHPRLAAYLLERPVWELAGSGSGIQR